MTVLASQPIGQRKSSTVMWTCENCRAETSVRRKRCRDCGTLRR